MASPGERVATTAERYVGVRENPLGSNRGNPYPDRWQRPWGLGYGWPWCGAFAAAMYTTAGVDDEKIAHPSTAEIYRRAKSARAIITRPIPGAMILWPGKHVGIVVRDLGGGVCLTVEGNSGDSVAYRRRAYGPGSGVVFVAPREVRVNDVPASPRRDYYLEDVAASPILRGPWRLRNSRERVIARLPADRRSRVRRVRADKGFAFYDGPRRVYGPWASKASRDNAQRVLEDRLGRRLRPYSRLSKTSAPKAESIGKTT